MWFLGKHNTSHPGLTVVVVVLAGQLLAAQAVGGHNLACALASLGAARGRGRHEAGLNCSAHGLRRLL